MTRNKHRADADELTTQRGKTRGINIQEANQGLVRLTGEGESDKTGGNTTCHTRKETMELNPNIMTDEFGFHMIAMKRGCDLTVARQQ